MKLIICRLLVGIVWCAVIVNAQETAPDYPDYIDEALIEETLGSGPIPDNGDAIPKEEEMVVEEVPVEEASVTEEQISTTTEATTPKTRRRLIQLRPRKTGVQRTIPRKVQPKDDPKTEDSTSSPAKPSSPQSVPSLRRRGSRRGGALQTQDTDTTTTEAPKEESVPSRVGGRRNRFRASSLSSRTASTSDSNSSRRSFSRTSISTTTEETTTKAASHRFSGRTNLRGRTRATPSTTDAKEEEAQDEHTPSKRPRQGRIGNARRKLRFRPKFRSGPNVRPTVTRTTSTSPPKIRDTTTTTTTTTPSPVPQKREPVTTTTEVIITTIASAPAPDVTEISTMAPAPKSQEIEVTTMAPAPKSQEIEVTTMAPTPAPRVTKFTTMVPDPLPQVSEATTKTSAPAPKAAPTLASPTPTPILITAERTPAVVPQKPIQIEASIEQAPVEQPPAVVPQKPIRIVAPVQQAPAVAAPKSPRRGSSRYSPPKDPIHPMVQTTQAPSNIFAPPLSASVKSHSRVSTSSSPKPSFIDVTDAPSSVTPLPKIETTTNKYRGSNYGPSDLRYEGGSVVITEIGTVEDTPLDELRSILNGFGSRRRGLGRPQVRPTGKKATPSESVLPKAPVESTAYDYYEDYYYYDY